jgi:3-oxoacyl-[acyl-carrier protein] reductase
VGVTASTVRVAVVTGGSRGIGRRTVKRLAEDAFSVAVGYATNVREAETAVQEVEQAGGRAIAIQADVADEDAVARLFERTEAELGGIDVVVHAAGRLDSGPLAEYDLQALDRLHRTNIRGTFVVGQQAVRRLRPGGALINVSSSVVRIARPGYTAYAASKGAVDALTLVLARELRGRDITVNAVSPGPITTDMFLDGKDDEALGRFAAEPPLERLGTPEDVAELVAFLASPAGRWVNGQVIRVNGGMI